MMKLAQPIQQFYRGLSPRDQKAVSLLAIFLALVCLYALLLRPAWDFSADARERYQQALTDNRWIAQNSTAINTGKRRQPEQSLLGVANQTAQPFQLEFKRFEPAGDNALNLWLDNVGFNNVVRWLQQLEQQYGIQATEIAVERRGEGRVNVRLLLQG